MDELLISEKVTLEEMKLYEVEYKKTLREIVKLSHPDKLVHSDFDEVQKEKLRELFEKAWFVRPEERLYDHRPLHVLRSVLNEVKSLYLSKGIELPTKDEIRGHNIDEKIKWIELEIKYFETDIIRVLDEIAVMVHDRDIQFKKECIRTNINIENVQMQMNVRLNELSGELKKLKKEFYKIFQMKYGDDKISNENEAHTDKERTEMPPLDLQKKSGVDENTLCAMLSKHADVLCTQYSLIINEKIIRATADLCVIFQTEKSRIDIGVDILGTAWSLAEKTEKKNLGFDDLFTAGAIVFNVSKQEIINRFYNSTN